MKRMIPTIVTGLILGFMLFWKLQFGLTRYFDADEFAYLHWAHNVFAGRLPYQDFLLYVPPGFLYFLAPLFFFFERSAILTAGRVFAWVVYVGICIALGFLMPKKYRAYFFLPGIILSFLPLPADKLLEIRPDNLAVLFGLVGMAFQIKAFQQPKEIQSFRKIQDVGLALTSGIMYGVSLLILPKTLPQVAVATLVAMWGNWSDQGYRKTVGRFIGGLSLPLAFFGIWALTLGDFGTVWYSLTKLPFEVNRLGELYPMRPDLFFYPNEIYYGVKGWSVGILANHAVWLVGLFLGLHRLLSGNFLIAGSLFLYIAAFMYGYELRHAQYLIPIAIFVSLYVADGLVDGEEYLSKVLRLPKVLKKTIPIVLFSAVVWGVGVIFLSVNQPKLAWTNRDDYARLERVLATVPKDSYIFDLTGATIYYRDPYYVSAVPYGEWKQYLSRPLPAFALPTGTYIYKDKLGRVDRVVPLAPSMYHIVQ